MTGDPTTCYSDKAPRRPSSASLQSVDSLWGAAARAEGQRRFAPALLEVSRAVAGDPGWVGTSPLAPVKVCGLLLRCAAVSAR